MADPLGKILCPISEEIIQQIRGIEGSTSTFLSCFEEYELLGKGGFGVAVKCRHKIDGINYVVKQIELQQTGMSFEKVRREVKILGKLRHPNIIRYYYCWVEEHTHGHDLCTHKANSPCLYIQMEYCPKKLSSYLLNVEMDMERRLAFIRQLVDAVSYMHNLGIIHRDLSCENILLDEQSNIRIIDFGLAVEGGKMEHVQSNAHGAHYYKAPELTRGKHIDSKVDIFSLGVLFFEILKDLRKNPERTLQLDDLHHVGPGRLPLDDLKALGLLITDMLAQEPGERPSASLIKQMKPWSEDFKYISVDDEQAMAYEQEVE